MKFEIIQDVNNFSILESTLYFDDKKCFYKNGEKLYDNVIGHSYHNHNIVVLLQKNKDIRSSILLIKTYSQNYDFVFNSRFINDQSVFVTSQLSDDRKKYNYFLYDFKLKKKVFQSKGCYSFGYPVRSNYNVFLQVKN